jgi:hypothetical protein
MNISESEPSGEAGNHLYGITGSFISSDFENIKLRLFPFGGHFTYDFAGDQSLDGQLVDYFGISRIMGHMDERSLSFLKTYNQRPEKSGINYSLFKEGDIWIGEYSGKDVGTREVKCFLHLIEAPLRKNLFSDNDTPF